MSKILIEGNKVIIDGHASDLETCNTLTNLCDELSKSEKFRTVKYESGYGEFESVSENKEKKFIIELPPLPPKPVYGYQVNIQSNDGTTILAQNATIDTVVVTSAGVQLICIDKLNATYTYSGSKLFVGLATSANAIVPKYKPGDRILPITADTTFYIVENIILPDSYSTLIALFSDIATVIREKTGDASAIVANNFPTMIRESLQGGVDSLVNSIINRTITKITNDNTTIGDYAFANCHNLTSANFPECESIGYNAFAYCRSLTSASFPVCTIICTHAFADCSSLTSANFPMCTEIGYNAFVNCSNLTSVSFPVCTFIGARAFDDCSSLTSANFPMCTEIRDYAFANCSNLTSVSFPVCTFIDRYAFTGCSSLTSVSFPVCTEIGENAFDRCTSLTSVSFQVCERIGENAFDRCYHLISLTLGASSVCSLSGSSAFASTPIGGYSVSAGRYGSIFVPASLLASYKTATNWSYFSSRFVGY